MPTDWTTDADDTPVPDDGPAPLRGGSEAPSPEQKASGPQGGVSADGEGDMHRSAVDAVDQLLDEVELALARLDDGTYGRCEECGEAIDDGRLAAQPIIRTCTSCDPDVGAESEGLAGGSVAGPRTVDPVGSAIN